MAYETLVGIQVDNDDQYTKYREAMTPILKSHGGGFRYDFKVSEVLANESGDPINRVFTIFFRDKVAKEAFFSNAKYKEIRKEFFDNSVSSVNIISEYEYS